VCSTKMNQQIRLNNIKIFIMYHEHAGSTLSLEMPLIIRPIYKYFRITLTTVMGKQLVKMQGVNLMLQ
jgi:hypothetical protein